MKLHYSISIETPENHIVKVKLTGKREATDKHLNFFLPSWSPGSYLMREYSRNIRWFKAETSNGEVLQHEQTAKGVYAVDFENSDLNKKDDNFCITYEIYCHELTVRTSHVDASHAFLHGPSYLMGIMGRDLVDPELSLKFPASWSKVTTGLKDISPKREEFLYSAENYDVLIDAPIEIGCHETDGFMFEGKEHHLAWYGDLLPHNENLKKDIEVIVKEVSSTFSSIPYENYTFITHFVPGKFGGLEHLNSTALQFSAMAMQNRKSYLQWLALVAHEYFHTWNVKRIRPKELGPFDYLNENYTKMHWLTEGLTSFMDEVFILRCGLCTMEEYLEMQKENLNRYLSTPGRKFHSLEDSSFNAWIKLYRPDENSLNSSVSYYNKGGIVFWCLNALLVKEGKKIDDLLNLLWKSYLDRPEQGLEAEEVFSMVREIAGEEVLGQFQTWVQTTEELDLDGLFKGAGFEIEYETKEKPWLGLRPDFLGDRVIIKDVALDGPAYKGGLNAGDEIIAINKMRILKDNFNDHEKYLFKDKPYMITVNRLETLVNLEVIPSSAPRVIKNIKVTDTQVAEATLKR
ncbi:MAG: putative metalloprotease with PDZ domain [Bacteriovoracaceae bacterium]|jgi:predicted metalloprotease with PDZ domain